MTLTTFPTFILTDERLKMKNADLYVLRVFAPGQVIGCVMRGGVCKSAPLYYEPEHITGFADWPLNLTDKAIRKYCKESGYHCEKL